MKKLIIALTLVVLGFTSPLSADDSKPCDKQKPACTDKDKATCPKKDKCPFEQGDKSGCPKVEGKQKDCCPAGKDAAPAKK